MPIRYFTDYVIDNLTGLDKLEYSLSWALGLLVTTTIVFALVADFLLLPTLLIALDRRN